MSVSYWGVTNAHLASEGHEVSSTAIVSIYLSGGRLSQFLYCMVIKARVCEQLAHSRTVVANVLPLDR